MNLEDRALHDLAVPVVAGLEPVLAGLRPLLRLWRYPAFSPYQSWFLLTPEPGAPASKRPALLRLAWDRTSDLALLPVRLDPVIAARFAEIDDVRVKALLEAGTAIAFPAFQLASSFGVDGETWGLEMDNYFFGGARLTWWCDGPPSWRPFTTWARQLAELLDQVVEESDGGR